MFLPRKNLEIISKKQQLMRLHSNTLFLMLYEKKNTDFILLNTFILVNYLLSKPLVKAIIFYRKPCKGFILVPALFLKTNRRGFCFKKLLNLELHERDILELTLHTCISFYQEYSHLKFLKHLNIRSLNKLYLNFLSLTRGKKKKMIGLQKPKAPVGEFLLKSKLFVLYLILDYLGIPCEKKFNLNLRQFLLNFDYNKHNLTIYNKHVFRNLKLIQVPIVIHIIFLYPLIFIFMPDKKNFSYLIPLYLHFFTQRYINTVPNKLTKLFSYLYLNRIQYTGHYNEKIKKNFLKLTQFIEKNKITFKYIYEPNVDIKKFFKYIIDIICQKTNDINYISIFCLFRINEQHNVKNYLLITKNLPMDKNNCLTQVYNSYINLWNSDWYFNIKNKEFTIIVHFKDAKRITLFKPFEYFYLVNDTII